MQTKLAIIAGEGKMPALIAREAAAKGVAVYVLGIKGNANMADFAGIAAATLEMRPGQLGKGLDFLKKHDVKKAVMAGRVQHINIFSVVPDMRAAKVLAKAKDMRAKSILSAMMAEVKKEGIEFCSSALYLERLMPDPGLLTKRAPTADEQASIDLGLKISKTLAALDVGLTSVICDRSVLAVEGMEGTDNCILRAGEIYKTAGARVDKKAAIVVVKVARPKQDERYDLPVIGKGTIKAMQAAGATALAVEAHKTLILDLEEVLKLADKHSIAISAH